MELDTLRKILKKNWSLAICALIRRISKSKWGLGIDNEVPKTLSLVEKWLCFPLEPDYLFHKVIKSKYGGCVHHSQ